jgi:hypothetical protein
MHDAMSEITRTLMRLGRELRYRELPIIGQRVVVESLDDVEHVLRQLVTPWITRDARWDGCAIEGGLAKYGILDRWCNAEERQLDGCMSGIAALRANGFAPDEPDPDPEVEAEARAFAASCLIDLASDLGASVLKLFLHDGLPHELRFEHNQDRYAAKLPPELLPNYFPRPFIVTDACITNAPGIWLGKHFYL